MIKGKLAVKDLGNPKKVLAEDAPDAKLFLGTLIGEATGISKRQDPTDPTKFNYGLAGTFEAIPAEAGKEEMQSGILYLPEAMHNLLSAPFNGDDPPSSIRFALEVTVQKCGNPIGYEYTYQAPVKSQVSDPLADIRKELAARKEAALPAPTPPVEEVTAESDPFLRPKKKA